MDVSAKPGRTPARYSRIGTFSRRSFPRWTGCRQLRPGLPAPTWIQFFRLWIMIHNRNYVHPQVMYSRPRCGRAGRGVEACRLHIIKETPGIFKFDHRAVAGRFELRSVDGVKGTLLHGQISL